MPNCSECKNLTKLNLGGSITGAGLLTVVRECESLQELVLCNNKRIADDTLREVMSLVDGCDSSVLVTLDCNCGTNVSLAMLNELQEWCDKRKKILNTTATPPTMHFSVEER